VGEQPTGRLGEYQDTADEDERKEDLERGGETPRDGRVEEGESKVDPVGNGGSNSDGRGLDTDEETSVVRLGRLGDP
jgi:hypothetical protein